MSDSSNEQTSAPSPPSGDQEVVARAGTRYRVTHYIVVVLLLGIGPFYAYDGFVRYPRMNAEAAKRHEPLPHGEGTYGSKGAYDVPINRAVGVIAPLLGIALLIRTLYRSRGVYRLANDVLYIPGHPPIPLEAICGIDKRKWDKKGIAFVDYETDDGQVHTFRLDDYLYDRPPTDKIFDRIDAHIRAQAG